MKLTKIVALLLCSILVCFTFAGCANKEGFTDYDWEAPVSIELEFDLYIFVENESGVADADTVKAQKTVNSKINQYLKDKYNSVININYVHAKSVEDYQEEIREMISSDSQTANGIISNGNNNIKAKGGTLVLITSEELHNELVEAGKLVDLAPFLDTKDFGTLNIQIASTLIQAATVSELVEDSEEVVNRLYCLPNNHVIGTYEYTVIDIAVAEGKYNFSENELREMTISDNNPETANDAAKELINLIETVGEDDWNKIIYNVTGDFSDKKAYEQRGEFGSVCNISQYPEATKEDALSSGFGILKSNAISLEGKELLSAADCEKRAMQILYAINSNVDVRNLLQYGVENTHYTFTEDGKIVPTANNAYNMDLKYTGDIFKAYFFSDVWTKEMAESGALQNKESVYFGN